MNAVGYIRVSSAEQADSGVSLAAQRATIEAYCAFKGLTLVEIVEDGGVSAGKRLETRVGGMRVLDMVAKGAVGAIVATKLDRVFRNAADCLTMTEQWNRAGVALHLLDMNLDTSTPMGRAFLTMAAAFAELERSTGVERTRTALAQVKAEGGSIGQMPLGLTRADELDGAGRRIVIAVDDELRAVERVVELRRSGATFRAIADAMNAAGIPTKAGSRWHATTAQRVCERAGL